MASYKVICSNRKDISSHGHAFIAILPGQFIATSAEVTPNGSLVRESPQNPLNSGLGIIVICPDFTFPEGKIAATGDLEGRQMLWKSFDVQVN